MLGRPNRPVPVFMKSLAGAWLNRSVAHVVTKAASSVIVLMCGKMSLTHMPDWPCCWNWRRVPSRLTPWLLSMKANRLPSM
jgi:hypothetical protein